MSPTLVHPHYASPVYDFRVNNPLAVSELGIQDSTVKYIEWHQDTLHPDQYDHIQTHPEDWARAYAVGLVEEHGQLQRGVGVCWKEDKSTQMLIIIDGNSQDETIRRGDYHLGFMYISIVHNNWRPIPMAYRVTWPNLGSRSNAVVPETLALAVAIQGYIDLVLSGCLPEHMMHRELTLRIDRNSTIGAVYTWLERGVPLRSNAQVVHAMIIFFTTVLQLLDKRGFPQNTDIPITQVRLIHRIS